MAQETTIAKNNVQPSLVAIDPVGVVRGVITNILLNQQPANAPTLVDAAMKNLQQWPTALPQETQSRLAWVATNVAGIIGVKNGIITGKDAQAIMNDFKKQPAETRRLTEEALRNPTIVKAARNIKTPADLFRNTGNIRNGVFQQYSERKGTWQRLRPVRGQAQPVAAKPSVTPAM